LILADVFVTIIAATRILVGAVFVLGLVVALTHWLVREGKIAAFGGWARFVRGWSDPLLRPVEQRVLRAGGNPQHAPWWLLGVVVVGGLVLIQVEQVLFTWLLTARYATQGGAGVLLAFLVDTAFSVLIFALLARVIGSWLGIGRHNRFMRIAYTMTDWVVEPIRRVMPPMGMFDFSPVVAWLVLIMLRWIVMRGIT
jgi:YggT family protein